MHSIRLPALVVLVALHLHASAQTLVIDSLFSPALGRMKPVSVLLPTGAVPDHPVPAIILLHGFGGNHHAWYDLTGLKTYLAGEKIIAILADGENSWYVNARSKPADRFEDYIVNDLVRFVAHRYNVDTMRLAIGGLSMGGYGALVLAMRHPDRFPFSAGLSASLDVPLAIPDMERNVRGGLRPSIDTAFGTVPQEWWKQYSIPHLVAVSDPAHRPYLYLANGISDEFTLRLTFYRELADTLRAHGAAYEYHETPGKHNWEYWDRELRRLMPVLLQFFRQHRS